MKRKRLLSILLALSLAFSLTACGGNGESSAPAASDAPADQEEAPAEGGEILLGTISPNTGSLAAYGTAIVNGAALAVDEINAAGGVNGQMLKLVSADDQGDPTECMNAFNSLVSQGVGLIVGSCTSSCTSAITDAANEEEVVLTTPSSTADTYSKGLYDSFAAACEKYGVEVAATESTASMDVQDYTNQFAAMVKAGVDLVYAPYYYDVIGPYVVTQARAAGYTGVIMGADGYDGTPDYVVDGADLNAFNDVYWTNHYDPADDSENVQHFVSAYEAKYGETPIAMAALAYDCVLMYKTAIENAGSADTSAVRDAMADTSVTYDCVTGTFTLDESGTPVKGATIVSFASDGSAVTTTLVDVVKELPEA